jgi:PAS domain S-box-containing protein
VISDAEGMITLVNRAAEDMFGYKRDELMGQPVEILVPATNRDNHMNFRSVYYELPEQRRQGAMELSAMRRNGSQFPVDLQLSYVDLEPEPLVMSFLIDVTDRKLYEDYLKSALQQERELGELKSRFVSTASHEFRTPLATILAAAETLATFRGRMDDAQIDGRLNKIRQQVMHLKGIMDEVLQLARIQAGKVEFVPAPADFDGLCQEIIEEFETQDGNNDRIQYVTEFHPVPVMIDGRLMRQVVTNLISNALKYSGEQPIHVTIKRSNKQVVLTVIDQGIGIPPDDLKRLFEPFHRATNVGTISGTGLGLSIAKQAVELHGGAIRVESEVNVGSTFTVLLPLMDENP